MAFRQTELTYLQRIAHLCLQNHLPKCFKI